MIEVARIATGHIVARMRRFRLFALLAILAAPAARTPAAEEPVVPDQVDVPAMKTSIYVGRVTLSTTPFQREGETYRAEYDARVFPWTFWSESGRIAITMPSEQIARLLAGELVEFTGEASNHKGKPRHVTGRAQPDAPDGGRIKVRIRVDGVELVFNGTYHLTLPPPSVTEIP